MPANGERGGADEQIRVGLSMSLNQTSHRTQCKTHRQSSGTQAPTRPHSTIVTVCCWFREAGQVSRSSDHREASRSSAIMAAGNPFEAHSTPEGGVCGSNILVSELDNELARSVGAAK